MSRNYIIQIFIDRIFIYFIYNSGIRARRLIIGAQSQPINKTKLRTSTYRNLITPWEQIKSSCTVVRSYLGFGCPSKSCLCKSNSVAKQEESNSEREQTWNFPWIGNQSVDDLRSSKFKVRRGWERDVAAVCNFGKRGRVKWRGILGREKNTCTPTGMAHFQ